MKLFRAFPLTLWALASVSASAGSAVDSALDANDVSFLQKSLEVQLQDAGAPPQFAVNVTNVGSFDANDVLGMLTPPGAEKNGVPGQPLESPVESAQTGSCVMTCVISGIVAALLWNSIDMSVSLAKDGRTLLLDNARILAVGLVILGHFVYFNLGYDKYTVYHDSLSWLHGFEGMGNRAMDIIGVLSMPTVCFVSGYVARGAPTVERVRRYLQFLVLPTLIWVLFAKPFILSLMIDPSLTRLQSNFHAFVHLSLFHNEWYLQALCLWRALGFLFLYHLRPSVALVCMLWLSCAAGYVEFEGIFEELKLAPTLGFLPYFAAGYTFPLGQLLDASSPYRSGAVRVAAFILVIFWSLLLMPALAQGALPDSHGPYTSSSAGSIFLATSGADHALYWTRRLARFFLEMVPTVVMITIVIPRDDMLGLSWIGPHTIYPFVFHEAANHWRDRFIQALGPPIVTSPLGHALVLLLHCGWAVTVLAVFSSSYFRACFSWCFHPTWAEVLFSMGVPEKAALAQAPVDNIAEKNPMPDNKISMRTPRNDAPSPEAGSNAASEIKDDKTTASGNISKSRASKWKVFPRLAERMPMMKEARPFYPVLAPLMFISIALIVLSAILVRLFFGFPSFAAQLEFFSQARFLALWSYVAVGSLITAVGTHFWHCHRLASALKPPKPQAFSGEPLRHVFVVCNYKEPLSVLRRTVTSIANQQRIFSDKPPTVVLACEARDKGAHETCKILSSEFAEMEFISTFHILQSDELVGKSSNENWAVREVFQKLVHEEGLDPFGIMLTIVDADSVVSPLYIATVEDSFWHHRDGRRLLYSSPLNTYRNLADTNPLIQFYEMLRSHEDAFFPPLKLYQPQSNYSLTLGFCQEIDFWTPDNIPEDVHTCRRAQVNNLASMTTVPIGAYIVNDLVEHMGDRYTQAKRHRWGVTEIAWVLAMKSHMPLQSWGYLLYMEVSWGTFADEACAMGRVLLQALILFSVWSEWGERQYGPSVYMWLVLYLITYLKFWLGELWLWRNVLCQFEIDKPSFLGWVILLVATPVLKPMSDFYFHIIPTLDCLFHVTFYGELVYVNAPKGTEEERQKTLAVQNVAA